MAFDFTGPRVESYYIDLLDNNDQFVRRLGKTYGGTLNFDLSAEIRGGGKVNVVAEDIPWTQHRLKIWYEPDEGQELISLGVYLPVVPNTAYSRGTSEVAVDLLDKVAMVSRDKIDKFYSVAANVRVPGIVRTLLNGSGFTPYSINDPAFILDGYTKAPMIWPAGTSKLQIINDLLAYINYAPLYVDANGVFQGRPHTLPANRVSVWTFESGPRAIHTSDWTKDQDLTSIPNKVILVSEGSSDTDALVGIAENNDPNSPYSIVNRGQVIPHYETGIEAESPSIINNLAQRKLVELSAPVATMAISHANLPIEVGNVVRFVPSSGDDMMAVVERLEYTLTPGSLCKTTLKEVVDL